MFDDWRDHDAKCPTRFIPLPDNKRAKSFGIRPWLNVLAGWLPKQYPGRVGPHAGELDWTHYRFDSQGRPLGRDGKPLEWVWTIDPATGARSGKLCGELVRTTDGQTEMDWLAYQRERAADHAAAARLLGELIRERAAGTSGATADEWYPPDSPEVTRYAGKWKGQLSKLAKRDPSIRREATAADRTAHNRPALRFMYSPRRLYELTEKPA